MSDVNIDDARAKIVIAYQKLNEALSLLNDAYGEALQAKEEDRGNLAFFLARVLRDASSLANRLKNVIGID